MGITYALFFAYIFGGLTFVPLLLSLGLLHVYLTSPRYDFESPPSGSSGDNLHDSNDDEKNIKSGADALGQKFKRQPESDVAEGYFAVCREYVPGGINGKPPERTTPAGEVVADESPSVYQSMYRSLFDRRQAPTLEAGKNNGKSMKRARNVFYVVLRHGHLMLYEDSEQVEVRHVIYLAHHDVSIHSGGENEIPEGELWIKRNAICLTRKASLGEATATSKPFYLFSENCSDKEDFYFALLQNQERISDDPTSPPKSQHFEIKDVITLVQRLHSSEEHMQTRWINALVGRLFLGIYKTKAIEDFVRLKITKKIARVKKPTFLSSILLQKIDLGEAAPYVTNPRLKDLKVEGDCCIEADLKYDGNFRLEIAATARIDLGSRFKAREVNLVLAVVMKKLEGHALIRFKPPPSNRLWVTFETMPHLEMSIEPIVSSRQITYGIILRAIESRIREVLAETIVLPHWDDSPFTSSLGQRFRGGIWVDEHRQSSSASQENLVLDEEEEDIEMDMDHLGQHSPSLPDLKDDRPLSMPTLAHSPTTKIFTRKGHQSTVSLSETREMGYSSGISKKPELPKAIRSRSFASAADPVLSTDNADAKHDSKVGTSRDAASSMIEISNRSQPNSPLETPVGSLNSRSDSFLENKAGSFSSISSKNGSVDSLSTSQATITSSTEPSFPPSPISLSSKSTKSSLESGTNAPTKLQAFARSLNPSENRSSLSAVGAAAAAAAKKWTWNPGKGSNGQQAKNSSSALRVNERVGTPEHPIGRGRPLPPPGVPLPRPEKRGATPIAIPKRKPLPPPLLPDRRQDETKQRSVPALPVLPPRTLRPISSGVLGGKSDDQGLLVVGAPVESEPTSPVDDGFGDFMDNVQTDDEDEEMDGVTPRALTNHDSNSLNENLHVAAEARTYSKVLAKAD